MQSLGLQPLLGNFDRIARQIDGNALLLLGSLEENGKHSRGCGPQFQFLGACFQTKRRVHPDRPNQRSPAVTDIATGGEQTIHERSIAQRLGVRGDFERLRSGGFPRRGFASQRFGIFFGPRFERFQIALQVVEVAHALSG